VSHSFRIWRLDGSWERMNAERRSRARRFWTAKARRRPKKGARGWDGAKRLNGRKRQLLVDTGGLVLTAVVHAANVTDRDGARRVLTEARARHPGLERVWADAGYTGSLIPWAKQDPDLTLTVVKRPSRWVRVSVDQEPPPMPVGLPILPRRWVVERSLAGPQSAVEQGRRGVARDRGSLDSPGDDSAHGGAIGQMTAFQTPSNTTVTLGSRDRKSG